MRKAAAVLAVVLVVAIVIGGSYWAQGFVNQVLSRFCPRTSTLEDVNVQIPKGFNKQTLVVLNFRPHGDANANLYAIGFARALADRLYCAPTGITQQMNSSEICCSLCARKLDPTKPVSDDIALAIGKEMAVAWVITGDMYRSGNQTKLVLKLTDTRSGKATTFTIQEASNALPAMQTQAVGRIIKGMGIKLTQAQTEAASSPNFSRPQTLELYARSFLTNKLKECETLRWQAAEGDSGATFPILRLLEFYQCADLSIPEIRSNKRLASLLAETEKQFPTYSHISALKGLLLAKQCRYADAETRLRKLVEDDPGFIRGHTALAYVAVCRWDGKLDVAECRKLVEMWPNNAYLHACLAEAYNIAAGNARLGHYSSDMNYGMRRAWKANCNNALKEAALAVKMDLDCYEGWSALGGVALQLGRQSDVDRAFKEKVRINPRNEGAYISYASSFSPQWGGSEADRQRVYAQAESVFGKDSPQVCAIRASTMLGYEPDLRPRDEILRNVELGLKQNGSSSGLLFLKSQVLFGLKRFDEAEAMAIDGVKRWDTPAWRFHLARCYSMRYQHGGDREALDKASELFADHAHEEPNDPYSFYYWGWCLSHQGRRAEARAKFLKTLELDPTNEGAKEKMKYVQ